MSKYIQLNSRKQATFYCIPLVCSLVYMRDWLSWLVCALPSQMSHGIHRPNTLGNVSFFIPLPSQTSHQIHRPNTLTNGNFLSIIPHSFLPLSSQSSHQIHNLHIDPTLKRTFPLFLVLYSTAEPKEPLNTCT